MSDLDVIVVTYNSEAWVDRLMPTLGGGRVIVVDNASTDGTLRVLKGYDVELIANRDNRLLTPAWIQGLHLSDAEYVALVNPDCEIQTPGWAARVVEHLDSRPDVGMLGPRIMGPDGRASSHAPDRRWLWALGQASRVGALVAKVFPRRERKPTGGDVATLHGAFLVIRRAALDAIGGFDDRYGLFWEEYDLSLRMHRAGWRTELWPDVTVMHGLGASTSQVDPAVLKRLWEESFFLYFTKRYGTAFGSLLRLLRVSSGKVHGRSAGAEHPARDRTVIPS